MKKITKKDLLPGKIKCERIYEQISKYFECHRPSKWENEIRFNKDDYSDEERRAYFSDTHYLCIVENDKERTGGKIDLAKNIINLTPMDALRLATWILTGIKMIDPDKLDECEFNFRYHLKNLMNELANDDNFDKENYHYKELKKIIEKDKEESL